jgi:S-adenosylmethionine/arginine decarboxylase-like enzyme
MKLRNELLIDLHECKKQFSEKNIKSYINNLCRIIKMKRHGKALLWEDSCNKIKVLRGGISAFQFLKTSSIVLHSFDKFNSCFIDVFSCKKFDFEKAAVFSRNFFNAGKIKVRKI